MIARNAKSRSAAGAVLVILNDVDCATPTRDGVVKAETEIAVTDESAAFTALAGATEDKTPKPREATATSAMRLKVVFVDICFLSISRSREFPPVGFG
jgi:hypothetical protein